MFCISSVLDSVLFSVSRTLYITYTVSVSCTGSVPRSVVQVDLLAKYDACEVPGWQANGRLVGKSDIRRLEDEVMGGWGKRGSTEPDE